MEYILYKLKFTTNVHFGRRTLDSCNYAFCADTLFSALCNEILLLYDQDRLERFCDKVKNGSILFSDAFPYIDNELYLPKPVLYITDGKDKGDSTLKKVYKNMKYVPLTEWENYLKGTMLVDKAASIGKLGKFEMKVSAAIKDGEDTMPYRIATFSFDEGNGLYIIAAIKNEDDKEFLDEIMESLSYSGIGGRRHSGLGRFELYKFKMPDTLKELLDDRGNNHMSLSICLPKEEELEEGLDCATYQLEKRSGFVCSSSYADTLLRKKDMIMFMAGSVFNTEFEGDIYV